MISQDLASIKSAGTYRREYDLSNMAPTYEGTYSRGRIVIGFSNKGPFNKPYLISDSDEFISLFGNIDPRLEANGCFFHRTAIQMLQAGPIIALNLHSYKEGTGSSTTNLPVKCLALGTKYATPFGANIKNVFSTSLWYEPWPDRLKDSINDGTVVIKESDQQRLCDFTSTGIATWNTVAIPQTDPNYMNFAFISEDTDLSSCKCYAYIEGETAIGKIHLCRIMEDGKTEDPTITPFDILLYKSSVYEDASNNYSLSEKCSDKNYSVQIVTDTTSGSRYLQYTKEVTGATETWCIKFDISALLTPDPGNRIIEDPASTVIYNSENDYSGKEFIYLANASGNDIRAYVYKTPKDLSSMLAYDIPISDYYGNDIPYELQDYLDEMGYDPKDYTLADFMFTLVIFNDVKSLSNDMIAQESTWGFPHATDLTYVREDDALFDLNGIDGVITYTGSSVPGLTNAAGVDISIDTYLRNLATTNAIVGYTKPYCEKSEAYRDRVLETIHLDKVAVGVEPYAKNENNYKAILHTLRDPDLTALSYDVTLKDENGKWETETTTAVYGHTNMWRAITDRMVLSFRYLVDCWAYGLEPNSKSIFSQVCQAQHATGLLNAPSALTVSKNANLVDDDFGCIDYKKLATTETVFSVPNIKDGATHIGYFYPWDRQGARLLPPAGKVSNLFMVKTNPWDAVAGILSASLTGYNPEVPLSSTDRAWLEALGVNAIIDAGDDEHTVCVYGNKTAKQKPVSALSALSFRDFVVYIMDEIENIIRPYVFKENTDVVRTEITAKVTNFLKSVSATENHPGGLTAFEVLMDSSNNTAEIIDNFYGVLDVKIEGARPMEKIAQRLYILPTGALTSNSSTATTE